MVKNSLQKLENLLGKYSPRNLNAKNGALIGAGVGLLGGLLAANLDPKFRNANLDNKLILTSISIGMMAASFSLVGYANQKIIQPSMDYLFGSLLEKFGRKIEDYVEENYYRVEPYVKRVENWRI
ncbi:hypothetical protein HYT56_00335 [Candidatus Woesearchaeota archaeon]|nr:hypothetical protein [Candidatus Woesearchaeota archaeon]